MTTPLDKPFVLHTNYRSTCSGRLRIALNLKGIAYEPIYVDTSKQEHKSEEYSALNPSQTVPCLQHGNQSVAISQSLAALEYLDEIEPDRLPRLLPPHSDPAGRAMVRSLAYIVAVDTQPLTSSRILSKVKALGGDDWSEDIFINGLKTYEKHVAKCAGRYSYGDTITMADVCLVPAVWKALTYNINVVEMFPIISRIMREMSKEHAVQKAHWARQFDCPRDVHMKDEI